jgi:hypothetical protein
MRFLLKRKFLLIILIIETLNSCFTGGTHGSIKEYTFPVSKVLLQKAIEKVILKNSDIERDTAKNYLINITNGRNDTIFDDRYNDGIEYILFLRKGHCPKWGNRRFLFIPASTNYYLTRLGQ